MEGKLRHPDRKRKGISCAKKKVVGIRGIRIIILTDIIYKNLRRSMEARKEKDKEEHKELNSAFFIKKVAEWR